MFAAGGPQQNSNGQNRLLLDKDGVPGFERPIERKEKPGRPGCEGFEGFYWASPGFVSKVYAFVVATRHSNCKLDRWQLDLIVETFYCESVEPWQPSRGGIYTMDARYMCGVSLLDHFMRNIALGVVVHVVNLLLLAVWSQIGLLGAKEIMFFNIIYMAF